MQIRELANLAAEERAALALLLGRLPQVPHMEADVKLPTTFEDVEQGHRAVLSGHRPHHRPGDTSGL
jgi:hypothetical protein